MDPSNCVFWIRNLLLVYSTSTTKLSINGHGDVCTRSGTHLSGKTCKDFSRQESLLILKSLENAFEDVWLISSTVSYHFFFPKSFCSDLTKFYTSVLFRKSVLCTKWILTIIALKWHVCQISTICTIFRLHNFVYYFSFNKYDSSLLEFLIA